MKFTLNAPYEPAGDQPKAIDALLQGLDSNQRAQTLLGVTGSGKTFTIANVIAKAQRPTLVISHNKTLAAQLHAEFSAFFPKNAIEYFVSYYDYYQPEAYIPTTGIYIEKDLSINDEIEKMRLRTASTLLSQRRDVIVVASVSCIYGLSNPQELSQSVLHIQVGDKINRDKLLLDLIDLLYTRNEDSFGRSNFRVRGDTVDIFLAYGEAAYRFLFFGDEIETIYEIDPDQGTTLKQLPRVTIYPANLFVTSKTRIEEAIHGIEQELNRQVAFFLKEGRQEEAERLEARTTHDITMMREVGYCSGIENYSRFFDRRKPNQRPYCLLDYFPKDYLLVIDESHATLPQIKAMWGGDHSRKRHLVEYGFRIPAAMDNRPLKAEELENLVNQVIYVSATPSAQELQASEGIIVEQIVRPTGLLDPKVHVIPTENQIDHLLQAIRKCIAKNQRILVTTLTKRMAEELSEYLAKVGIQAVYMHSEVKTLDRVKILAGLREGQYDVLVGVNLLREGLDLPEVSLLAIFDADKEGFLRNTTSLIQTIGRVARHVEGQVFMYADKITASMEEAIRETKRRRSEQLAYNQQHGITPKTVQKAHQSLSSPETQTTPIPYTKKPATLEDKKLVAEPLATYVSQGELKKKIRKTEQAMEKAAKAMDYLKAQQLKEELETLKSKVKDTDKTTPS